MYILNQSGTQIYNSDFFDHFLVSNKGDKKLVIASHGRGGNLPPCNLGIYASMDEAKGVLFSMLDALCANEPRFEMPLSEAVAPELTIYDKRIKRKGGS